MKNKMHKLLAIMLVIMMLSADICAIAETVATLTLPSALQVIEEKAFYNDTSIGKVVVPEGTTEIRSKAFANSSLTEVELPDTLTFIADDAFEGCGEFMLTVPENCYAYEWAVENGYAVEVIKPYVFTDENGIIYSCLYGTAKVVGYSGTASELVIPDRVEGYPVTAIGANAFATTSTLSECCSLTSIVIPDSVTTIEDSAFFDCDNLENIDLSSNLVTIGSHAFWGCGNLRAIKLPDSVEEICDAAFMWCYRLIEIDMPTNLKAIEEYAFYNCGFSELELPEGLLIIGSSAFGDCYYLTRVKIPKSVTSIGAQIFNCYVNAAEVVPGSYAEEYCIENEVPIYVEGYDFAYVVLGNSTASVAAYRGTSTVAMIPSEINGYDIVEIHEKCFRDKDMVTKIVVPESVTSIEEFAFEGCSLLSEIEIPSGVTSIGGSAFLECTSLTEITIPVNVESVGISAFQLCSSLADIVVEDGNSNYSSMDGVLFADDEKILHTYPVGKQGNAYAVPDGVIEIGEGSFHGCRSLTSVIIPNTVVSIKDYAFNNCSSLTSVAIPESVTSIGDYVFKYVGEDFAAQVVDGSYAHDWCEDNNVKYIIEAGNDDYASEEYFTTEILKDGALSITGYTSADVVVPD